VTRFRLWDCRSVFIRNAFALARFLPADRLYSIEIAARRSQISNANSIFPNTPRRVQAMDCCETTARRRLLSEGEEAGVQFH